MYYENISNNTNAFVMRCDYFNNKIVHFVLIPQSCST